MEITQEQMKEFLKSQEGVDVTKDLIINQLDTVGMVGKCLSQAFEQAETKTIVPPTVELKTVINNASANKDIAHDILIDMVNQEDKMFIMLLDKCAEESNNICKINKFNSSMFDTIQKMIELHRIVSSNFLINREQLSDIVRDSELKTTVEPTTERELIIYGYIGNYFATNIITSSSDIKEGPVASGTVYCLPHSDVLGSLKRSLELTYDESNDIMIATNKVEIFIVNKNYVAKGIKI